jgi:hypothetical protein
MAANHGAEIAMARAIAREKLAAAERDLIRGTAGPPPRNGRKEALRRSLTARMDTNDYAEDDAIWDEI